MKTRTLQATFFTSKQPKTGLSERATFLCSVWHDSSNPGTERALHITSPALKGIIINENNKKGAEQHIDSAAYEREAPNWPRLEDKRKKKRERNTPEGFLQPRFGDILDRNGGNRNRPHRR